MARLSPLVEEQSSLANENRASEKTRIELVAEIEQMLEEKRDLRAQNRHALEVMREWLSEPDEDEPAWWTEFNRQLERHRLNLRQTSR